MPLLAALALTAVFAGMLVHSWWPIAAGGLATLLFLLIWLWPRASLDQRAEAVHG